MRAGIGALAAVLAASACEGDEAPRPRIDAVLPDEVAAGERLDVLGARFCEAAEACADGDAFVTIGALEGIRRDEAELWTDERLVILVPPAVVEGATTLVVTVEGRASEPRDLRIVPVGAR
jgi:hypothetical protein